MKKKPVRRRGSPTKLFELLVNYFGYREGAERFMRAFPGVTLEIPNEAKIGELMKAYIAPPPPKPKELKDWKGMSMRDVVVKRPTPIIDLLTDFVLAHSAKDPKQIDAELQSGLYKRFQRVKKKTVSEFALIHMQDHVFKMTRRIVIGGKWEGTLRKLGVKPQQACNDVATRIVQKLPRIRVRTEPRKLYELVRTMINRALISIQREAVRKSSLTA